MICSRCHLKLAGNSTHATEADCLRHLLPKHEATIRMREKQAKQARRFEDRLERMRLRAVAAETAAKMARRMVTAQGNKLVRLRAANERLRGLLGRAQRAFSRVNSCSVALQNAHKLPGDMEGPPATLRFNLRHPGAKFEERGGAAA